MTMISQNSNEVQFYESTSETEDINASEWNSKINNISENLESLINKFNDLSNSSQSAAEQVLNQEAEAYVRYFTTPGEEKRLTDLKESLKKLSKSPEEVALLDEIDLLNDSSLGLLKILGQNTGWGRTSLQFANVITSFLGVTSPDYANTPFQCLIPLVETIYNEQNNISDAINSITVYGGDSLEPISKSIKSINENFEAFKNNVIEWRKQKKHEFSDMDRLKVITLTNVIRDMIININYKKTHINTLKVVNMYDKINKIRHQKAAARKTQNDKLEVRKKFLNMKSRLAAKKALDNK